ncbi:ABC transporter substrate-binding protein [Vreelandella populi]|uniref:ABC transporter substrate-binding protein n=1 Tax=Vreelandella populi TaxID=2498858 RepID=A0A3S1E5D2_9GAMM|nr:ABC transporter substrate-binding protein [Halomonas populi]RUR43421.1 ABC transporter substrate-binding protein [Halomonas populi]
MKNFPLSRRRFLSNTLSSAAIIGAAAVLPRSLMASGSPEITAVEIISVRDPQHSAQLAFAIENGYFAEEGLDVTANYTVNGPDLASLAASGRVKVLCAAMEQVALLRLRNLDFKWVMKLSDISNTQGVVVGNNAGIESPADLVGKRVGMYAGAAVELAVENMCKEYGVDFSSIEFVNMEPPEQAIALMRGDIDAMACWEPYISNAERSGGRLYFTGSSSYIENPNTPTDVNWLYLATGLATTGDYMQQAPNTMMALMRAMIRANETIINNPAAAVGPISKGLGIPADGLELILRANDYRPNLDQRLVMGYPDFINWTVDQGFLSDFVPFNDIVDTSLLQKIAPNSVKI